MKVLGLHHVAVAHQGDSPLLDAFGDLLGLSCAHTESAPGFTERMLPVGDADGDIPTFVQLLEGVGDEGVVNRFLERRGPGLHHVAFQVDDVAAAVAELHAAGIRMVDDEPRPGGMGTTIAFVHPSAFGGLLVELVEVH